MATDRLGVLRHRVGRAGAAAFAKVLLEIPDEVSPHADVDAE